MSKLVMIITVALMGVAVASPAFAYLDAGSGSMLVQLILGGIAGLVVVLKLCWKWLLAKLGLKKEMKPTKE